MLLSISDLLSVNVCSTCWATCGTLQSGFSLNIANSSTSLHITLLRRSIHEFHVVLIKIWYSHFYSIPSNAKDMPIRFQVCLSFSNLPAVFGEPWIKLEEISVTLKPFPRLQRIMSDCWAEKGTTLLEGDQPTESWIQRHLEKWGKTYAASLCWYFIVTIQACACKCAPNEHFEAVFKSV